jgi:hypothetical protein
MLLALRLLNLRTISVESVQNVVKKMKICIANVTDTVFIAILGEYIHIHKANINFINDKLIFGLSNNIWPLENWNRKNLISDTIIYKLHDYKFHACSTLIVEEIRKVFNLSFLFSFRKPLSASMEWKCCVRCTTSLHKQQVHNFQFSYLWWMVHILERPTEKLNCLFVN